jgi:endonuclease-3
VSYQDTEHSADESDLTDLEDLASPPPSLAKTVATRTLVKQTRKVLGHSTVKSEVTVTQGGKTKPKRAVKQKKVPSRLEIPHPPPDRWQDVYGMIKDMRKKEIAPVDTMGCQLAGKDEIDPKVLLALELMHIFSWKIQNARLACLASLILSPQTKDEVCSAALEKLRVALGGAVSLQALMDADEETIRTAIKSVGFWQKKAMCVG